MTAKVVRVYARKSSSDWRHRATCAECAWAGGRFKNPDSADRQARTHNEEKHS